VQREHTYQLRTETKDKLAFAQLAGFVTGEGLRRNRLDVYAFDLDPLCALAIPISLDGEEMSSVMRLTNAQHRRRVLTCRKLLRLLIGTYIGSRSDRIALRRDALGKPHCPSVAGQPACSVSVSRSGPLATIAVGIDVGAVGVDLELIDPACFPEQIAALMLSPGELRRYAAISPRQRPRWLARAWVGKEAVLKGLGRGLHNDPASVELMTFPGVFERSESTWRPVPSFPAWQMHEFQFRDSTAAVAVYGSQPTLRLVELIPDSPRVSFEWRAALYADSFGDICRRFASTKLEGKLK
jgi:phosphopantetheinyl transferase